MKEQHSALSTSGKASSVSGERIRSISSSLVVVGGFICCAAWLYQSTPILLKALGTFLHQFAEFYVIFSSLVIIAALCLTFAYVFDELHDRHHLHVTRRQYREMQLDLYQYEIAYKVTQWCIPRYYRHQGIANAYMQAIRYNLFHKPPNGNNHTGSS